MPKKKDAEHIDSFEPDRLRGWAERMSDDQATFALQNAAKLAEMYAGRSQIVRGSEGQCRLDDRLRDVLAPLYAVAAVIDHAGCLVASPELDRFAIVQARLRGSDATAGECVVAAHALFEWAAPRWQKGKVLIETAEATELFKAAEIESANDSAKTKALLRKLGGQNKPDWWMGKTKRGWAFSQADLQDLVDRHPVTVGASVCPEEKR